MQNDRPIQDANLREAMKEIRKVMERRGLAGACMLVAPQEAAYIYGLHAPWSAIRVDETASLGFRIRAVSKEDGEEQAHARLEGAVHTLAQLRNFGERTMEWMAQVLGTIRDAGIDFEDRTQEDGPTPPIVALDMRNRGQ